MQIADHLITTQSGHTHHGLYAGEGNVIHLNHYHYTVISNLEEFCQHQNYFIRPYPFRPYSREGSLQRAFELLQSASPTRFDTEEQFVAWCINGASSTQDGSIDWKHDVLQPVSQIVVESLVSKAWDTLTKPDKLIKYACIGTKVGKLIRYLK